jgi:RNA-directed DNA polymerase
MDDWIAWNVAPMRWKLRKAIKIVNRSLNELKVDTHPDHTRFGHITRGFDFW